MKFIPTPPSTPDLEDDPSHNADANEEMEGGFVAEGGFLPEETEDVEDSSRNFIIQKPTPECPHFRIVPASGFIPTADTKGLVTVPAAPSSGEQTEGCTECGALSICKKFQESFGVKVCQECIDSKPDSYGLVTKSTAIDEYCVGEADLEGLGCIRRRNPRKDSWNEMRLLLRIQVAQRSLSRHGSAEGIEQARRKRTEEAVRRKRQREGRESVLKRPAAAARTPEAALADDGGGGLAGASAGCRRRRAAAEALVARAIAPRHVHAWGPEWQDPTEDLGSGTWRKKCEGCGLVTTYEKL